VSMGSKLLTLDDRIAQAALAMASIEAENDASLKISKIEFERLKLLLERAETGFQQKAVAQFELEAKRSEYQRAAAQLELEIEKRSQLAAKKNMAQQEADSMALFAPFDGIVTQIHAKVGDAIGPSENAVSVANTDFLEVEMHLPLKLYGDVKAGKLYQVRAGEPVGMTLSIKAKFVAPEVESTSGSFRVTFEFDNRETAYPSGFEVHFIPPTDTIDTVVISTP
jgi:RND family efflux transporter MFP subunit